MATLSLRWGEKFRSSPTYVCIVVCFAIFTDTFLYSVIVPVTPFALEERAGASEKDVQWWTSIFLATFGAAHIIISPIIGAWSDRHSSRQLPFLLGIITLALSTVLFWVGRSLLVLVSARALQGVSGTVVWVIGMAMVNDVSETTELAKYMSWTWAVNTVGSLSGPAIGGLLFHHTGYHSIFVAGLGLLALDIILRVLLIEQPTSKEEAKQPSEQSPLLSDTSERPGLASEETSRDTGLSGPDTAELSTHEAGFNILLCSPRVDVLMLANIVNTVVLTFFETTVPLFLIRLFRVDAGVAGLMFLPLTLPTLLSPLFSRAVVSCGTKWPTSLGTAALGGCLLLMAIVSHNQQSDWITLVCLLAACGCARSVQRVALSTDLDAALSSLVASVEASGTIIPRESLNGKAYGLNSMSCGVGVTLGPLLSGFLVEQTSWQSAALFLGISMMLLVPPMLIWIGEPRRSVQSQMV